MAKADLKQRLAEKALWTKPELVSLLSDEFGVSYSASHLHHLLRQLGMRYYKPEPEDYRRHPASAAQLVTRLQATFDALLLMHQDINRVVVGVADESSMQNYHHASRFWSMFPHCKKPVNSNKHRINAFGFHSLNGQSMFMELPCSKEANIIEALQAIRKANASADRIIVIWDNYRVHQMASVQKAAKSMGISLVQLPAYAPDLNPIERLWKGIKKTISNAGFIADKQQLLQLVTATFKKLEGRISWFKAWIKDILCKALPQHCPSIFGKLL